MSNALNDLNDYLQANQKLASLSWHDSILPESPKHNPTWTSTCKIDSQDIGIGTGGTKRLARIAAATAAMAVLTEAGENSGGAV